MTDVLRVATYNIHKGVQGVGPRRRLEIHNLAHAVEQFDADIVCLQEVRKMHQLEAKHFARWPVQPQADYLAPEGYRAVYQTNAYTRHGEHGNALLSRWPVLSQRHEDMSDHRFEQRGLLHVVLQVHGQMVHVVVVHLGLIRGSRVRQMAQLAGYIQREVPPHDALLVAGDFNDWGSLLRESLGRVGLRSGSSSTLPTFPSRLPLVQFDHIYARGMQACHQEVPRGSIWGRMSDHLPLIVDFQLPARSE
jgi:endonuclease/exonuclease/phosphatase family metal-dependent hydrolase